MLLFLFSLSESFPEMRKRMVNRACKEPVVYDEAVAADAAPKAADETSNADVAAAPANEPIINIIINNNVYATPPLAASASAAAVPATNNVDKCSSALPRAGAAAADHAVPSTTLKPPPSNPPPPSGGDRTVAADAAACEVIRKILSPDQAVRAEINANVRYFTASTTTNNNSGAYASPAAAAAVVTSRPTGKKTDHGLGSVMMMTEHKQAPPAPAATTPVATKTIINCGPTNESLKPSSSPTVPTPPATPPSAHVQGLFQLQRATIVTPPSSIAEASSFSPSPSAGFGFGIESSSPTRNPLPLFLPFVEEGAAGRCDTNINQCHEKRSPTLSGKRKFDDSDFAAVPAGVHLISDDSSSEEDEDEPLPPSKRARTSVSGESNINNTNTPTAAEVPRSSFGSGAGRCDNNINPCNEKRSPTLSGKRTFDDSDFAAVPGVHLISDDSSSEAEDERPLPPSKRARTSVSGESNITTNAPTAAEVPRSSFGSGAAAPPKPSVALTTTTAHDAAKRKVDTMNNSPRASVATAAKRRRSVPAATSATTWSLKPAPPVAATTTTTTTTTTGLAEAWAAAAERSNAQPRATSAGDQDDGFMDAVNDDDNMVSDVEDDNNDENDDMDAVNDDDLMVFDANVDGDELEDLMDAVNGDDLMVFDVEDDDDEMADADDAEGDPMYDDDDALMVYAEAEAQQQPQVQPPTRMSKARRTQ